MTEVSKVEKKRLRGRNMQAVVQEIVNEYNSSNGWALVKVVPTVMNLEVYLERSEKQAEVVSETTGAKDEAEPKETVSTKATEDKKPTKAEMAKAAKAAKEAEAAADSK